MKYYICILTFISIQINLISNYKQKTNTKNIIHFIRCGSSDSILIESNGKYGLIDSSNPYKYIKNEIEKVKINLSKGEKHQWSHNQDESVQAVINYLKFLKIKKLNFVVGTHAHSDHIGGIPAIAYHFVNNETRYYYKKYRKTIEDKINIDWANYKYYLAAINSMKYKNAKLIDITNKTINFKLENLDLELLNTGIDPNELNLGENQNSIGTLIKYNNIKIFLAADMLAKEDKIIKDYLGKINILKLAHHGYSETSYEFLSKTKPDYIIITNNHIPDYSHQIIAYAKENFNSKIYLTHNIKSTSESIEKSAIKLFLNKNYFFENTGKEVTISKKYGWSQWIDKYLYFDYSGLLAKKWKKIDYDMFYFGEDGILVTGWQKLNWKNGNNWFYFDKDIGYMVTGWQKLNKLKEDNWNWIYFMDNGVLAENKCFDISGDEYCFGENGYIINY